MTAMTESLWAPGAAAVARATGQRVRILAYHGVNDAVAFARQMTIVREHFSPIGAAAAVAAFNQGPPLPDRAVWVTFDDGLPSVVEQGLPVLRELGLFATLFVCPGLIESGEPNWWDVVDTALEHGLALPTDIPRAGSATASLKAVPDLQRREVVSMLALALRERGFAVPTHQLNMRDLDEWTDAGNDLGNHSWDHACLDRCAPDEQRRQVLAADVWLRRVRPSAPRVFAYPNGNSTPAVEQVLSESGYELALRFDHRLASLDQHRYRISRLRVSSAASEARFAAILSGAHGVGYRLKRRLAPRGLVDTALRAPESSVDTYNRDVYEQSEIVEQFVQDEGLTPPEQALFDTYVRDGVAVLDLGVGGGRTVAHLSALAGRYVGIDYSAAMVDACRAKHPSADIRLMDASDLHAFDDAAFDIAVFSYNGLDYLHPETKRRQCIDELARVTRDGAIVILSSHNAHALVRPRPQIASRSRALAIQAYGAVRLARFALPSRAFWRGEGYLRDSATPHVNFATTPARMAEEFGQRGFRLVATFGARYPAPIAPWEEPWYYYAFERSAREPIVSAPSSAPGVASGST